MSMRAGRGASDLLDLGSHRRSYRPEFKMFAGVLAMITLEVTGMTCGGCVAAVERIIKATDRKAAVKVDLASGRVEADTATPAAALVTAIEAAGYGAKAI